MAQETGAERRRAARRRGGCHRRFVGAANGCSGVGPGRTGREQTAQAQVIGGRSGEERGGAVEVRGTTAPSAEPSKTGLRRPPAACPQHMALLARRIAAVWRPDVSRGHRPVAYGLPLESAERPAFRGFDVFSLCCYRNCSCPEQFQCSFGVFSSETTQRLHRASAGSVQFRCSFGAVLQETAPKLHSPSAVSMHFRSTYL